MHLAAHMRLAATNADCCMHVCRFVSPWLVGRKATAVSRVQRHCLELHTSCLAEHEGIPRNRTNSRCLGSFRWQLLLQVGVLAASLHVPAPALICDWQLWVLPKLPRTSPDLKSACILHPHPQVWL